MKDQAKDVTNLVEKEVAFMERMKADAHKTATALIQSYLGPDHRVIDMHAFHSGHFWDWEMRKPRSLRPGLFVCADII